MFKYNLLYYLINVDNTKYYGFIDTGGGKTFLFRNKKLIKDIEETNEYLNIKEMHKFPDKVILFIGQDYFKNKIFHFNYKNKTLAELSKSPSKNSRMYKQYRMIKSKTNNFIHTDIIFENKKEIFLFDTGATLDRNKKQYAISFLDGRIFDKLQKKYKTIKKYDADGSPVMIIPEVTIFGKVIKNVKFLRRKNGSFSWMSKITKIKHIGAIGGNVLKHFNIICDYKNVKFYVG